MNPTRWAFLYHGLQQAEVQQMEVLQATLAKALGLNLLPFKDDKGKVRLPETFAEMAPLARLIAPNDRLVEVKAQWDAMLNQEKGVADVQLPNPEDDWEVGPDVYLEDIEKTFEEDTEIEVLDLPRSKATQVIPGTPPPIDHEDEVPRLKSSFTLDGD